MKKKERDDLINEFRAKALAAGKPFEIVHTAHGIRIQCGSRSVRLNVNNSSVLHPNYFERRLGLRARDIAPT